MTTLDATHLAHAGVGTFYEYGTATPWWPHPMCGAPAALGDFWMHCLVAEGAFDVAVEPIVSLWDLAALTVIVEEAGGRFTDLSGRPGPAGGSALSSNGRLHDEVLARFR